ncbi:MAG TPA: hypothetical protein VFX15_03200 [Actinomycetes bacterium]|nr:hypothetical protein [Actinomycetes bacterium]
MALMVSFLKSDAMAEQYPNEPDEVGVQLPEAVQLTYALMRDTLNDRDIAHITTSGDWIKDDDGSHWSDIVIFEGLPQ